MSNIDRVTIVLSDPMKNCVTAAIACGAFVTSNAAFRRAALMWGAAPERRPPAIEAPGIADDERGGHIQDSQVLHHSR